MFAQFISGNFVVIELICLVFSLKPAHKKTPLITQRRHIFSLYSARGD